MKATQLLQAVSCTLSKIEVLLVYLNAADVEMNGLVKEKILILKISIVIKIYRNKLIKRDNMLGYFLYIRLQKNVLKSPIPKLTGARKHLFVPAVSRLLVNSITIKLKRPPGVILIRV